MEGISLPSHIPCTSIPQSPPILDDGLGWENSWPLDYLDIVVGHPNSQFVGEAGSLVSCSLSYLLSSPMYELSGYAVISESSFHPSFELRVPDSFSLVHPGMRTLIICLGNPI